MSYEIQVLRTEAELAALKPEWRALYEAASPRNPFLSWDWTVACRHVCPGAQPYVVTARRDGQLAGIAPLRLERRFGLRVLRFIGDGRSDYLGFLRTTSDVEAALLRALEERRGDWDLAVLRQLNDIYTGLNHASAPGALCTCEVEGTVAPYLAFDGDWDALVKSGPGWLKRMAKASRKWVKDGGTIERHTGPEAAQLVDEISSVEGRSWKGEQGVARFQPGAGQEFLRETLGALSAQGEMEIWLARWEGRAVAFEINFLTPQRLWLYQGAYDEAYRKYSPGGVLDFLSIERAWKSGVREYDFMSGDEPYKAERTDATRPIRYRAVYPDSLRGHIAFALLVAPRWKLKGFAPARAALQFWIQVKNNPARLLERG